jgi:TolB protein
MKNHLLAAIGLALVVLAAPAGAAQDDTTIWVTGKVEVAGFPAPIPVHIAGFSGEADATIRFDLFFMGFKTVPQNEARYLIQGKNDASRVEGVVYDVNTKQSKFGQAFTGVNTRAQTHALADAIAKALGRDPIAQTRIAFVVQPTGVGPGEIFVADYDGRNAQPVTQDGVIVAAPAWGGKSQLFYTSYKFGKPDILTHDFSTGSRKAIVKFNGLNTSATVSPDGRHLAMILSKSGNPQLCVSGLDGSNPRQLTTGKGVNACPCWSPDNRTICFSSDRSGGVALYTVSMEGGTPVRVPTSGVGRPTEPDWSPDGKFIVFTSQARDFTICVVPMEGTQRGVAIPLVSGQDPAWAPNSRAVVYARHGRNGQVLALLDVPTKQSKDIAPISGNASQPSWGR